MIKLTKFVHLLTILTRFKFVQLLTILFPSNLEVYSTSTLSWPARNTNIDVYLQWLNNIEFYFTMDDRITLLCGTLMYYNSLSGGSVKVMDNNHCSGFGQIPHERDLAFSHWYLPTTRVGLKVQNGIVWIIYKSRQ